jgi:hypothetical protein
MAFRFIFWGDNSQNTSLVDSYTQQAENDFRKTYRTEFENVSLVTATPTSQIAINNSISSTSDTKNAASAVVSELIQAVTENKTTETFSKAVENSGVAIFDLKESAPENSAFLTIEQVKAETSETLSAAAESIKNVSQTLNEEKYQQNTASNLNTSNYGETFNNELNDLIEKMKTYLNDLRTRVTSLLEYIQKPHMQYYHGVEDTLKDASKKEQIALKTQKQQEILEEKIKQIVIYEENKKQFKNNQVKSEKELQSVKKAVQSELDEILTKRMDEARKKSLFDTNFLPK